MKDFLLIGNKNCIAHKDFFRLMMDRRANIGYTRPGDFDQPDGTPLKTLQGLTRWFTTLSVDDKPSLTLTAAYNPEKYPKYDNYDAINVNRVRDIPYDYEGVMGVPITIFDHNLDNIEIVWKGGDIEWAETECDFYTPPTKDKAEEYKADNETWRIQNPYYLEDNKPVMPYNRIFIKLDGCLYGDHTIIDGKYIKGHTPIVDGKHLYTRILIRRKQL